VSLAPTSPDFGELSRVAAKTLSIVIPVYNEKDTWRDLYAKVTAVELPGLNKQIVMVDDGSKDGTRDQLRQFADEVKAGAGLAPGLSVKVIFHEVNQGKGAALRTGFQSADGDLVIIQDADLEYDPNDYPKLIAPILAGEADVVYGSRFLKKLAGRPKGYLANYMANRFLTWLSNRTTGLKLTDMETCYKVFAAPVLKRVRIEQNRFGFEPEITARVGRLGVRVKELPISYFGRTHEQGKKIGWKDGLKAIWCILKYGVFSRGGK
jgi:glycosyltransferase involved in cell wall biosynthesis